MTHPRLLTGCDSERVTLRRHAELHGPPIRSAGAGLRDALGASGLRGRGGGAFPLARKLDAAARSRRRPVIVANGCEGEPMSSKDRVLLRLAPHLVIDGALAVGEAVGADRILLAIDELDVLTGDSLEDAVAEREGLRRGLTVEIVRVPPGYVTGQESALVNWCNTARAQPKTAPPRVSERGIDGRPTVVSNAETLAHASLIARHGAGWFREAGTAEDPGTALITLSGAIASPGVYEIDHGASLGTVIRGAGGLTAPVGGFLIGGYAGGWVTPDDARSLRLERADLQRVGTRLAGGIIVALPAQACPVSESARVIDWLAAQSSGQCGPCDHGLTAIADAIDRVAVGDRGRSALADAARWATQISGRGACAHPDGAVSFVSSALRVFRADFLDHADHGRCDDCDRPGILQVSRAARVGW